MTREAHPLTRREVERSLALLKETIEAAQALANHMRAMELLANQHRPDCSNEV